MVAHPHGVTFGQTVGESFAIVRAPRAAGVAVQKRQQCAHRLARLCRGALPDRLPEKKMSLPSIRSRWSTTPDVDQQGQTVIPGGGAVVMANYQTHIGNRVLFTLRNAQGPLPFGASARLIEEEESGNPPGGMVADGGRCLSGGCREGGNPGGELDRQQPSRRAARCIFIFRITHSRV